MLGILATAALGQFKKYRGIVPNDGLGFHLLLCSDVREDLALSRTQAEAIDAIGAAGKRRDDELFKGIDRLNTDHADIPPFSTSHEEWRERATFAAALLTPVQKTRLRALQFQSIGTLALFEENLQKELGLSSAQIAALTAIDTARVARWNERLRLVLTVEQYENAVSRLHEEVGAETLAILTPAQRNAYGKILGKPVESATRLSKMLV